jgi:DnaJ-class molecular chaperone
LKPIIYELLEVERTADDATIKSSYRKLAMRWHPDKNPGDADAKPSFKAISEAYECLKDPQKRAAYDRFGHEAFKQGMGRRRRRTGRRVLRHWRYLRIDLRQRLWRRRRAPAGAARRGPAL